MNTSIIELVATNTGDDTLLDTFFFEQVTYKNVSFCQEKFGCGRKCKSITPLHFFDTYKRDLISTYVYSAIYVLFE